MNMETTPTTIFKAAFEGNLKSVQSFINNVNLKDNNQQKKATTIKNDIVIRKAELKDVPHLKEVCRRTFFETFADQNTPEDMEKYLETNFNENQITKELNTPGSQFYLAFLQNKPVAYIKLNVGEAQTEEQGEDSMEIQRIYVVLDCKGYRIGSLLMKQAEEEAHRLCCTRIWLGVWEHNYAAISFYEKRGYRRFGEHVFVLGTDAQTDYLMEKKL
ncbi:acetyltransferase [Neocallimastix californiae]|uniref:Acetyltransferase n=1 Tax=Neocallimastix californiae TaxID=1754190 RepID=A0A1Y2ENZ9_9FUNG|nr:acetyltransferase [Neocallimastix californiae]|eukprot:ORY72994.1 acetyltransferase [Neocallimastix californiae]